MALIKCPECGAQVSSNANQCVHCGCRYSVCPECGSVYVGAVNRCPTCGYQIAVSRSSTKNNTKATNSNSGFGTDVMAAWESRSGTDKTVMKVIRWVNFALYLLVVVFAVIAFIIIEVWDGNSLESLFNIKSVSDNAHGMIIACCVVGALAFICGDLGSLYSQVLCSIWLRKNYIDVSPYIKQASGQVEMSAFPQEWDYENLSSAAYLAAVPNDKSIRIAKYIICSILAAVAAVCCGIFLTQNADELLRIKVYGGDFNFKYIALIPTAIFIGLFYLASFIGNSIFDKRKANWIESMGL